MWQKIKINLVYVFLSLWVIYSNSNLNFFCEIDRQLFYFKPDKYSYLKKQRNYDSLLPFVRDVYNILFTCLSLSVSICLCFLFFLFIPRIFSIFFLLSFYISIAKVLFKVKQFESFNCYVHVVHYIAV